MNRHILVAKGPFKLRAKFVGVLGILAVRDALSLGSIKLGLRLDVRPRLSYMVARVRNV